MPAAFALAQRALAKAESLALTDALLPDFLAGALAADVAAGFFPFAFAQRALWAAAILARAAALIVNFSFSASPGPGSSLRKNRGWKPVLFPMRRSYL